jgi:hypothetical protein
MSPSVSPPRKQRSPKDEFFLGWLPMPAGYVRFVKPMTIALLLVSVITAGTLAFFQRDPGSGQWDDAQVVTLRGIALTRPYAMLRVVGEKPGELPRTYLLVEDGKFGALPRVSQFVQGESDRLAVEVRGTVLHRGDRWMIALEEGDIGMRVLSESEAQTLPSRDGSGPKTIGASVTLHGEIIDPKCYLGAMKPGGGKTHKACAMRCIAGGIPPMLVTREADGRETFYLMVTADGGVANDLVYPFVGDRVDVTGSVEQQDDTLVLRVSSDSIRRR